MHARALTHYQEEKRQRNARQTFSSYTEWTGKEKALKITVRDRTETPPQGASTVPVPTGDGENTGGTRQGGEEEGATAEEVASAEEGGTDAAKAADSP